MTFQAKRQWQFGLRSLFALVLVVAAYFGSWPWLEEWAIGDVEATARDQMQHDLDRGKGGPIGLGIQLVSVEPVPVAPYVLRVFEWEAGSTSWSAMQRRYYLWLFGWTVRLPITTSVQKDGQPRPLTPTEFVEQPRVSFRMSTP